MSDLIRVSKIDEVSMRIEADGSIKQEISDVFAFRPPSYQFNPKFKAKVWDGWIRLFNPMSPTLYIGLLDKVKEFASKRGYELKIDEELYSSREEKLTEEDVNAFVELLISETSLDLEARDYQLEYIFNALKNGRSLSKSPTSSGKSFIIHSIQQFYYRLYGLKTLIIVPNISLVLQIANDFKEYGTDPDDIHTIYSGEEKYSTAPIIISTWQSLVNLPKSWFEQFQVVLGDEAHTFQAKSLTKIMTALIRARYRHGFTGTINSEEDAKVHKFVLEGLFGPIEQFVTTRELIDQGTVADFSIKGLILNYPPETRKLFNEALKRIDTKKRYSAEREFLANNSRKNKFLRNLIWSLKDQNNLILFDLVEKHGKILEPMIRRDDRTLFFIHGGVDGKEREAVRHAVENEPLNKRINIWFGAEYLSLEEDELVHLVDGSTVLAKNVTKDHDISSEWIDKRGLIKGEGVQD